MYTFWKLKDNIAFDNTAPPPPPHADLDALAGGDGDLGLSDSLPPLHGRFWYMGTFQVTRVP